jgi:hypothetical protein
LKGYVYGDGGFINRPSGFGFILPAMGAGTSTLDPANTSSKLTLSGSNLIATANTTNSTDGNVSRATTSHSSGRYYAELKATSTSGSAVAFGIINGTQAIQNHWLGESGNNSIGCFSSGSIFLNGSSQPTNCTAVASSDVIGMAVDIDHKKIWWRKNGGQWNNNASADPALNISGLDVSAISGPYFPAVEVDVLNKVATVNLGGTPYTYTPPTGFVSW